MYPWHFRPENDDRVHTENEDATEWEDNAVSNTLAWASWKYVPRWCEQKDHWTTRLADSLFTTCPCCMFYRGIMFGFAVWIVILLVAYLVYLIVRMV